MAHKSIPKIAIESSRADEDALSLLNIFPRSPTAQSIANIAAMTLNIPMTKPTKRPLCLIDNTNVITQEINPNSPPMLITIREGKSSERSWPSCTRVVAITSAIIGIKNMHTVHRKSLPSAKTTTRLLIPKASRIRNEPPIPQSSKTVCCSGVTPGIVTSSLKLTAALQT